MRISTSALTVLASFLVVHGYAIPVDNINNHQSVQQSTTGVVTSVQGSLPEQGLSKRGGWINFKLHSLGKRTNSNELVEPDAKKRDLSFDSFPPDDKKKRQLRKRTNSDELVEPDAKKRELSFDSFPPDDKKKRDDDDQILGTRNERR